MNFAQLVNNTTGAPTEQTTDTAALWGYLNGGGTWVDWNKADYMAGRFGQHKLQMVKRTDTLALIEMDNRGIVHDIHTKWVNKQAGDAYVLCEATLLGGEKVTLFLNTEKNSSPPRQYIGIAAKRPYTPPKTGAWVAQPAADPTDVLDMDEVPF